MESRPQQPAATATATTVLQHDETPAAAETGTTTPANCDNAGKQVKNVGNNEAALNEVQTEETQAQYRETADEGVWEVEAAMPENETNDVSDATPAAEEEEAEVEIDEEEEVGELAAGTAAVEEVAGESING
uniref:Uncharacterized protein n=1 Tax=Bactrocera dorsalis TaxID=27457 RepID=A0A034W1Q7_BACDO